MADRHSGTRGLAKPAPNAAMPDKLAVESTIRWIEYVATAMHLRHTVINFLNPSCG